MLTMGLVGYPGVPPRRLPRYGALIVNNSLVSESTSHSVSGLRIASEISDIRKASRTYRSQPAAGLVKREQGQW